MVDGRYCPDCGQVRPLDDFTRDRRRRDGLAFYCRQHARLRLNASKARRQGRPETRHALDRAVPAGSEWCPDCDSVKPLTEFPTTPASPTGRHSYCRPCHNARGRASLAKVGGARTYHLERRYGITAEEADQMLADQGRLRGLCRTPPAEHVHHDHATVAVRDLLCSNCNGGLGQFRDDPALLRAAARYVEALRAGQAAADDPALRELFSRPQSPPVGSSQRSPCRAPRWRRTELARTDGRREAAREVDE